MKINRLLLDPGTDAAGWPATIPPEYEPVIKAKGWKSPFEAVKSYGELEKVVGTARLEQPQANWTPEQYDKFYQKLGRPEKPEGYKFAEVKLAEGLTMDEEKLNKAREHFHKLGFTPSQAEGVFKYYVDTLNEAQTNDSTSKLNDRAQGEIALKQELGDKYDMHVDLAKGVVRQFGSEEFLTFLEGNKLANHPQMIKMLAKIGQSISEDTARGEGKGLMTSDATAAQTEINKLTNDSEFWKAMNDKHHPGHSTAVSKWTHLHGLVSK